MSITINADDPKTIRALELAADAGQWLTCRTQFGDEAFGVPSQSQPGRYYLVTGTSCDCPDFRRTGLSSARLGHARRARPCKHIMAVRLHRELVKAMHASGEPAPMRRGHLSVVPSSSPGH